MTLEEIPPLSDARKEQIKLRATFVNNIGIGVILIGVFTPIIRSLYEPSAIFGNAVVVIATMAICFSFGATLHFIGSLILRGLNK